VDKLVHIGQWIVQNGLGLVVVILCFGFIIFIHELGHFLMAKRVGIRVHEFALGFGPRLISRTKGETEYCLRLFPVGGYVKMEGEDTACENPDDSGNFQNKTVWQRIKVVASGPLMNYMVALLIFWLVGFAFGVGEFYLKPQVGEVMKDMPAEKIGLKSGDYIVEIDGKPINDAMTMIRTINNKPDQDITIKVQRGEGASAEFMTYTVRTAVREYPGNPPEKIGVIGFIPNQKALNMRFTRVPPGTVLVDGLEQMYHFTAAPMLAIYMLATRKMDAKMVKEGSAGPVGIGQMFFEMYKRGFGCLLYLCAVINVLIGCFNLVPFPALDGSRIFILAISGLIKKPFNQEKEGMVHLVGFIILLMVVVFFTYFDIVRLIQGGSFFK
jgi:regulator of sigma E protease